MPFSGSRIKDFTYLTLSYAGSLHEAFPSFPPFSLGEFAEAESQIKLLHLTLQFSLRRSHPICSEERWHSPVVIDYRAPTCLKLRR